MSHPSVTGGLIVAFALAFGLSGCSPSGGEPAAAEAAGHVGRQTCARCHAEQHEAWRGSHHDLAMQEAASDTVLGDFGDATFAYNGVTSTFFERNGGFFITTDGPDGGLRDYEIVYTFGVEPLQQYLIRLPGGRLQALSIAWDARRAAAGGQRWFHLYSDERVDHEHPLHWTGPYQNWNSMCAECHSTRVRRNYDPQRDRFETTWAEIDVSCEACHGPGSRHVAWAEAVSRGGVPADPDRGLVVSLKDADGGAWLMNAETGIAERRPKRRKPLEPRVCARCHSRRALVSEDHVHGAPLLDTHRLALLTEDLYHADGQILGEVYVYGSFLQSRMHAAGVSCKDCHDPHGLKLRGSVDTVCARCHLPARFDTPGHNLHGPGSPGARCIACHMPERNYMVVDPRGDHSFRVPRPDLSVKLGTPNPCAACHADRTDEWAAAKLAERYGTRNDPTYAEALHAGRRGGPGAQAMLLALVEDPAQPAIARATGLTLLQGARSEPAIRRALGDDDPLVRLAALEAMEGFPPAMRPGPVLPLLEDPLRAVRLEAARQLAPARARSLTPKQRERLDPVLDEYRRSRLLTADRAESRLALGLLELDLGHPERAEAEYRHAIAMDAHFPPAYVNLADLYRMQGREEQGERILRAALEIAPGSAEVHHALGLLLVRQNRSREALDSLRRAWELRPQEARYGYVYGVGLHSAGQTKRALAVLEAGHRRHPEDRDLLVAAATISRDSGDLEAATDHARSLVELEPQDPEAVRLLRQLERMRGR